MESDGRKGSFDQFDVARGLETVAELAREKQEIGAIICRYLEAQRSGQKITRADCLAMASSEPVAQKADKLLDVVDILLFVKKKQQGG